MRTMQYCAKLSFSGVTGFQQWEGDRRVMAEASMRNLINAERYLHGEPEEKKKKTTRKLSQQQQKKLKKTAGKLAYYSAHRKFENKKNGKRYSFKVAFLTLTAPPGTKPEQFLKAFEGFLSYLRRTANCVYIWKKELGKSGKHFHIHLLINNFIPYYIVSWKWKMLLIGQGVRWPVNEKGVHTNSHTRIEIPHSRRQINHYIAKYLSKGEELPSEFGFIWGFSDILKQCEEIVLEEGEYDQQEVQKLKKFYKVIEHDFFTHICVDPAKIKKIAPELYRAFKEQALLISYTLSLPQRFQFIE